MTKVGHAYEARLAYLNYVQRKWHLDLRIVFWYEFLSIPSADVVTLKAILDYPVGEVEKFQCDISSSAQHGQSCIDHSRRDTRMSLLRVLASFQQMHQL